MEGGTYSGQATVSTSNAGSKTVEITIEVLPSLITNQGYDDPASQSRLAWLNSQAGRDADFIIDPYLPVTAQGQTLSILGRDVELGSTGLPAAITSYFTEEMTSVSDAGAPILAEPLMLFVQAGAGLEQWQPADFEIVNAGRGRAEWVTDSQSENFNLRVEGALEYDGMLDYRITLTAEYDIEVQNITLPITYASDAATWLLGLGHKGQKRPASIDWKWVVFKGLELKGIYGREMFETWYKMAAMLQSGLDISPIITHHFPIDDFQQGFDIMCSGNSGKVILDWTGTA